MTDTCLVEKLTGRSARDPDSGLQEPVYETVFTSPCKVQDKGVSSGVAETEQGARVLVTLGLELHIPVSKPALQHNYRVTITAIGDGTDPQLLNDVFYVVSSTTKSKATARRVLIERR